MPSLGSGHQHSGTREDHFCVLCIHSHIPGSIHTSSVHHPSPECDRIMFGKIQFEWEVIQKEGRGQKLGKKIQEESRNTGVQDVKQEKENTGIERRKVKWLIMEMEERRKDGRGIMGSNKKLWM